MIRMATLLKSIKWMEHSALLCDEKELYSAFFALLALLDKLMGQCMNRYFHKCDYPIFEEYLYVVLWDL